jgi:hypothetical protein
VLPAHRLDDLPPGSVNAVDLCQGFHTRRLPLVKREKQRSVTDPKGPAACSIVANQIQGEYQGEVRKEVASL